MTRKPHAGGKPEYHFCTVCEKEYHRPTRWRFCSRRCERKELGRAEPGGQPLIRQDEVAEMTKTLLLLDLWKRWEKAALAWERAEIKKQIDAVVAASKERAA